MKSRRIGIGLVCCIAVVLSGCVNGTSNTMHTVQNLPKIKVGCDDYPPFSYMDAEGNQTGIDVEIAKEAFSRLGYDAEMIVVEWENKKELLENGEIDCIWSCFSMNGREAEYKWAGPYMDSHQVIAVQSDSDIETLQDLKGKMVAVHATTKPEEIVRNGNDSRIPELKKVISLQKRDLMYAFLSKGYVDAIATHDMAIEQFMSDYDVEYRILDEILLTAGLGVAFSSDDERGLDEQLSQVFEQMHKDGTMEQIVGKYLEDTQHYLGAYTYEEE